MSAALFQWKWIICHVFNWTQILLESIGRQVDDVASNWAGRLKGLLQAVESADAAGATDEEKVKSGTLDLSRSSTSSSVVEEEDVDEASLQSQHHPSSVAASTTCTSSTQPPFSLYRWYSSLSLKLSWLQTSHTTVFDNILYTFYFRLEWLMSLRKPSVFHFSSNSHLHLLHFDCQSSQHKSLWGESASKGIKRLARFNRVF